MSSENFYLINLVFSDPEYYFAYLKNCDPDPEHYFAYLKNCDFT
jgi:hypothetical protein